MSKISLCREAVLWDDGSFPCCYVCFSFNLLWCENWVQWNSSAGRERKKGVRTTVLPSPSCVGWERHFGSSLQMKQRIPSTEVHLIQHNLTCPYRFQAVSAAAPFLALEGDQAEVVQTPSIGATHAIRIWSISTKIAEHIYNRKGILLLLPCIMEKGHIPLCLILPY